VYALTSSRQDLHCHTWGVWALLYESSIPCIKASFKIWRSVIVWLVHSDDHDGNDGSDGHWWLLQGGSSRRVATQTPLWLDCRKVTSQSEGGFGRQ
jgi:hypothetical protein